MVARKASTKKHPTISEIAERAGVSAGAVSYALNGRPGVSEETRARIVRIADEIGWVPSSAARALRGGGARTVGLVITREPAVLRVEPFFMSFVAGIEQVISDRGYALMLHVTPDERQALATYQQWWSSRRVDGVFLTDLTLDDARLGLTQEIGLPAVVVGDPLYAGDAPAAWSDDARIAETAVQWFADLGHRRIGHVTGPATYVHTRVRSEAMRRECQRRGIELVTEVETDYTYASGSAACEALLGLRNPPTAVVFDNDVTALAGVRAVIGAGLRVPEDISILAWDDSPLCELSDPPLSALSRDVSAYGAEAATILLALIENGESASVKASDAALVMRKSVGPAAS